jgi:L-amino acid N-acyltransferase YncA
MVRSEGLAVAMSTVLAQTPPRRALGKYVEWARARHEDAAQMADVYNHWVVHGARVPGMQLTTGQQVGLMLAELQGRGYPVWCFWADSELVGWCSWGPFPWGGSGTLGVSDFSVYVLPNWVGAGVGAQAVFLAYRHLRLMGFRSLVVWVLRGNRLSRNLAHGVGLEHWGTLPRIVDTCGSLRLDVELWGCHLDDPVWCARMDRLASRLERRFGGWMRERRKVAGTQ